MNEVEVQVAIEAGGEAAPRPGRWTRPAPRPKKGQALVELCLVLPFLLAIANGILEVGVLLYVHLQLTGATSEVAKIACLNIQTPAQLQTTFDDALQLNVSNRTFTVTTLAQDAALDNLPSATIMATYTQPWIGFFRWNGSDAITLRSMVRTPVRTDQGVGLHP